MKIYEKAPLPCDTLPDEIATARFWSKVDRRSPDECWLWTGGLMVNGYGRFTWKRRHWRAHRISYFLHHGSLPGLMILHSCDNPKCVNPAHLRPGTQRDNMDDKVSRDRTRRGELHWTRSQPGVIPAGSRHWNSVLTEESVSQIRRMHEQGEPIHELARRFNYHRANILRIIQRKLWKHVP